MLTCVCCLSPSFHRVSEVTSSLERLKAQNAEKANVIEELTQKLEAQVSRRLAGPQERRGSAGDCPLMEMGWERG